LGFETVQLESIKKKLLKTAEGDRSLVECYASTGIDCEMRDPDGNIIGLCKKAFDVSLRKGPVPIRHIALYTPDPQRLADFYCDVLDMQEVERADRSFIFVSDGYFNLALLYKRTEEPLGLNHFGFHVRSNDEMRARAEKAGVPAGARRARANSLRRISCSRSRREWHRYLPEGVESIRNGRFQTVPTVQHANVPVTA
jgi:catechol 2,3-dioxygenase-like lactoylglutathione lyase family enzyme